MRKLMVLASIWALGGCAAQGALSALGQAPAALNDLEQIKVGLVTAPIAGCVSLLQSTQAQLNNLQTGTPGLPMR